MRRCADWTQEWLRGEASADPGSGLSTSPCVGVSQEAPVVGSHICPRGCWTSRTMRIGVSNNTGEHDG